MAHCACPNFSYVEISYIFETVRKFVPHCYQLLIHTHHHPSSSHRPTSSPWMPRNSFGSGPVPCSLISQRVKIPPVLFTRVGVEANSGRVSLARGNLKSLERSLARSKSETVVGYAKRRPSVTQGKFDASMGMDLPYVIAAP